MRQVSHLANGTRKHRGLCVALSVRATVLPRRLLFEPRVWCTAPAPRGVALLRCGAVLIGSMLYAVWLYTCGVLLQSSRRKL